MCVLSNLSLNYSTVQNITLIPPPAEGPPSPLHPHVSSRYQTEGAVLWKLCETASAASLGCGFSVTEADGDADGSGEVSACADEEEEEEAVCVCVCVRVGPINIQTPKT